MNKIPNPGLSTQFNRCLSNLDQSLPRRSRRDDHGAQFLESAIQLGEIAQEASQELTEFLKQCERFRTQQYWTNPEKENHETSRCWLPVVVVGGNWSSAVQSLLRLELPPALSKAKRIVLKPVGSDAAASLRLMISSKIGRVSETVYDRFRTLIKSRFTAIESTYDPQAEEIEILAGKKIEMSFESHDSPDFPLTSCAAWLEFLLQQEAIESLELTYPLRQRKLTTLGDVISGVLVIPVCPVKWRKKQEFPQDVVRNHLADALEIGPSAPYCLVVSAVEQEWMPLIDHCIRDAISLNGSTVGNSEDESENSGVVSRHLSRRLVFPPEFELRTGSEYDDVYNILRESDALTPLQMLVSSSDNLSVHLRERLNDVKYVLQWQRYFSLQATSACQSLEATASPQTPPANLRRVPGEFITQVNTSVRQFAAFILSTISTNLNLLATVEEGLFEEKFASKTKQSIWLNGEPSATSRKSVCI